MKFDFIPTLFDDDIYIDSIELGDFEALYAIASNKDLWLGHPKKDRYKQSVFEIWFEEALAAKTALKITDLKSGKVIGSSRYYDLNDEKGSVAIGYTFIAVDYWGGIYNYTVKTLMLNHAFKTLNKVIFHADPTNIRSQKAILKLGAQYSHIEEIESDGVQYYCYELSKAQWEIVTSE